MKTLDEIEYVDKPLSDVIDYFAKDFKPKKGKILDWEYFIDTAKNHIVFRLFIRK